MFRKLHIQMTLFSTFITSAILTVMTLACLFIAETSTHSDSFTTFQNNMYSCITHLENQLVLSHQWLKQIESNYEIQVKILDNENPLFFQKFAFAEEKEAAFEKAAQFSRDRQNFNLDAVTDSLTFTKSTVFQMEGYYACTAAIPRENGLLKAVILHPLETLEHQIFLQRCFFGAAVLLAIAALTVFSWFFTRKMLRPLEKSRKRQTEFIASASHELRSPLAVILSSLQAMEQAPPEDSSHFSAVINQEGLRMSRLIDDMLSLANADNKTWKVIPAPCELDTLLLDTFEKYEPLMQEKQLRLLVRLPEEGMKPYLCDSSRISQVLGVLLDNAMSYVPSGGQVTLSLSQSSHHVLLTVADNGPGIPDSAKEYLFQRFYRADSARSDEQHFGLGLCIAHEIIQLHKGTLTIKDTPGGGAAFLISLPKQ